MYELIGDREVLVGYHLDGDRRVPMYWPVGQYEQVGAWVSVGGRYDGYNYITLCHTATGFRSWLTNDQFEALVSQGKIRALEFAK